jgi:hypothetical protein
LFINITKKLFKIGKVAKMIKINNLQKKQANLSKYQNGEPFPKWLKIQHLLKLANLTKIGK